MEFLRFRPQWLRDTGNGLIDVELTPETNFRLHEVRLSLDAVGGDKSFTISLTSGTDPVYDTLLATQDMTATDSYIFRPGADQQVLFEAGDTLKFDWANDHGTPKVYGLEIIWSPVY